MSTLVAEMTQESLQQLISKTVRETMVQVLQDPELRDPDYGLLLQDWVVNRLESDRSLAEEDLISAEQIMAEFNAER